MPKPIRIPKVVMKAVGGAMIPMYPISALAMRVNRDVHTIRQWERIGILPKPMFRDAPKARQQRGRRLYTHEEIEAIAVTAQECEIKPRESIANTKFAEIVKMRLEALHKRYGAMQKTI